MNWHMLFLFGGIVEELVKKARDGDRDAFVELVHCIEKDLYMLASVKINNLEDVNDVIQETMLRAFEGIKNIKEPQYFKTWITKILINECNKFYIKKFKFKMLFNKFINNSNTNEEYIIIDTIENKIDSKKEYKELMSILNKDEKIVIILFFYNKFTKQEILKILDISINTVKTRLRRAENKLNEYRKGDNYEE